MALQLAKLTRPEAGQALLRQRLFTLLDGLTRHPVIWIGAPAGAGKTTLASSYLAATDRRSLWYQMDGGDRDLASFFHYLGKALKACGGGRKKMPVLSPAYQHGLEEFTRHYFRELFQRLGESALLVLDNFQEIGETSEACTMLALACEEIPAGCNIVVISRNEPAPSFARLRATQRLGVLSWDELRFTLDEALAIARQRYPHLEVSRKQLQRLDAHIQGWVTGLILLLEQGSEFHSLDAPPDAASRQFLFDYFASEILAAIEPATRQFLIRTAVFPRMTAAICRQLTGNSGAAGILSELARKQYFTLRRGSIKPRYEYHPLFRQFLQHQAQENLDEGEYRALQQRAGLLLAEAGNADEAANLLIDSQSWSALSTLILKHAPEQLENGRNRQVARWIGQLPSEMVAEQPWLSFWLAKAQLHYDNHSARELFEKAYHAFKEKSDAKGLYLSWCGVSDAYRFAHDHFAGAAQWIDELNWLQGAFSRPLNLELRIHLTLSATGLLLWVKPDHGELPQWIARLETLYRRIPNDTLRIMSAGQLCIYYSQMGEIEKIRKLGTRIRKLEAGGRHTAMVASVIMVLKCSIDWLTGDLAMDREAIDKQQQFIRDRGLNVYSGFSLAQSLYHANCRRDLAHMETLLASFADDIDDDNILDQCYYQLHACNLEILRDNHDRALNHADLALELAHRSTIPFSQWLARALLAYLHVEKGQYEQAEEYLDAAQSIVQSMKSTAGLMMANMIRCYLACHRKDHELARRLLATAFRLAREKGIRSAGVWPPRLVSSLCNMALEHDIETDYARDLIRLYRYTPQDVPEAGEHWPWPLKVHTLGRFSVLLHGRPLDVETRPFALIKALLSCGGRDVHEERIMDMLWPDADGNQAQSSFKTTLHRLRKVLGDTNALLLKNHRLTLNEQTVWVDSWTVSRLFARAETAIGRDKGECASLATRLAHLYRGHFLANETSGWVLHKRDGLRHRFFRHLCELARFVEDSAPQTAIHCYHRLLELDSQAEEAWQGLIRCHQAQGRETEARAWQEKYLATFSAADHPGPPPGSD